MSGKNKKTEQLPEDSVKLKPLFGVRPGVYLAVLYGAIICLIAFFLLFFPGIINPGSKIRFDSEPLGAAVRVDGVYIGTTPCTVFVPRGQHTVTFVLPGFAESQSDQFVRSRIFASLFAGPKETVTAGLTAEDPVGALAREASEYARWSFAGEPTAIYQIPLSLSEGVYRAGTAAADSGIRLEMEGILSGAARFSVSAAGIRDLIRAKTLLDNSGNSPSPVSLAASAADILVYLSGTPGAASWLAGCLPLESATRIGDSAWLEDETRNARTMTTRPRQYPAAGGITQVASLRFRQIPGGTVVLGSPFPREQTVESFWICETEVGKSDWDAFVRANPVWSRDNIQELTEQGLVTGDYLTGSTNPAAPVLTVPGVSWHAAKAFCAWLTGSLGPAMDGYEIRLPREAEWEYAAKLDQAAGQPQITDMLGGYWEWCEDPYAHLSFLPAPESAAALISSPDRSVRGGSWINPSGSVQTETRGSLAPETCSPFVSFRPVIAGKRGAGS
ncbi:SUMF1/EgtB/PvdO family nonheme iron enzyme [Breznakiella homolactica]|uniref:SUMF1/EgtB/PvdO family nonheme iron enzyme n=1 Tax=Breznakiella homolactica TaxID=2798577 RepID=A0A7T7XKA6_9SPIR|nr:SUMF1/EgtB/PvdO family nonheme iron enzyme [Breznakiella homolactica]QQO07974.1 SUMF1/EgtB/PvdO family nonheme iron enzyme [Breznakiella homolactica]